MLQLQVWEDHCLSKCISWKITRYLIKVCVSLLLKDIIMLKNATF